MASVGFPDGGGRQPILSYPIALRKRYSRIMGEKSPLVLLCDPPRICDMPKTFHRSCLTLKYPANWQHEIGDGETGWTAVFQAVKPDTAFVIVSYHPDADDVTAVLDGVLDTLREEYPKLEVDSAMETISGLPAIGHDIEFFALDFTNTCLTRAVLTSIGVFMVMRQCTDEELAAYEDVMDAVVASIAIEDERPGEAEAE